MKQQQTFWESSNRPLFIKSVWIESSDGGHRHFILDYDSPHRLNDCTSKTKKALRSTNSCDFTETHSLSLQLIGSTKACKPLEPPKLSNRRRSQTPSSAQKSFLDLINRKGSATRDEPLSKRSSLQDIHNDTISCDDKLAERVLNWLDLAGKTTIFRHNAVPPANPATKKTSAVKREKASARSTTAKRPDSVKHITIIFNKEGIPVRYNRPIRFSDLFRSGYNASKKFSNSISSRQGKTMGIVEPGGTSSSQGPGTAAFDRATIELNKTKSRSSSVKRMGYEGDYKPLISKQILEDSCNLHEAKKQLHIFMPSLPKKTLTATDCDSSCLSTVLSDYCKI